MVVLCFLSGRISTFRASTIPIRGFDHANREIYFFKVLKSSTLNWSSRENQFSNQPIQGFSKETLPKQNKPLFLIWLHNGKGWYKPQQLYPFLMQVMGKSKWIVGNLTRIHIGCPLSSNKVATTTSHHFTLHKHMTCWWNIIMLLSWWSHQMCPFYSDCFNKYMCVCLRTYELQYTNIYIMKIIIRILTQIN